MAREKKSAPPKIKHRLETELYKALENRYLSQRNEGLATLHIYFNNSVGIGEHPQIVDEMAKQLEKVENADGKLDTLAHYFGELGE